jgi:hypothetical protein
VTTLGLAHWGVAGGFRRRWDNEADENVIESVTLTYDSFDLVQ